MSTEGQGTKRRRKIAENFNRLSRVHQRYRQTTDGRAIAYSEREREFTFANKINQDKTHVARTPVFKLLRAILKFFSPLGTRCTNEGEIWCDYTLNFTPSHDIRVGAGPQ